MKLDVVTLAGGKAGQIDLSDAIFGIGDIRLDILARCVNWQLAKRRAGTHKVQTRNENSRTGKKMAGHMGVDNVTTLNVTVFRVDAERGLIILRGSVPGTDGGYVKIRDAVKRAAPADLPIPGAFKSATGDAGPAKTEAPETEAAEAQGEAS